MKEVIQPHMGMSRGPLKPMTVAAQNVPRNTTRGYSDHPRADAPASTVDSTVAIPSPAGGPGRLRRIP